VSKRTQVLVVEDNEANQMLARAVLEREGFQVDIAGSPEDAIAQLSSRVPDLILMDVQLPGQDGLSLTRQLKADPAMAHIPIVALTAHAMTGDRENCLAAGMDDYITKPIHLEELLQKVEQFSPCNTPTPASG
jgi:CheY-like chemotaxis protein